jgi:formimidoylglutamate deiminase
MRLFAADALLSQGWRRDVRIDLAADGTIAGVVWDARPDDAERLAGPLIPGISNVHSHAFQRALAGRTGRRSATRDSFWTWRQAMYAFIDRVDADAFEAIAAQAYVEMLRAGYTAVAEFHYVHHDPSGNPYAIQPSWRSGIVRAAGEAGIVDAVACVLRAFRFRRAARSAAVSCTRSRSRAWSEGSPRRRPTVATRSASRRTACGP